MVDEPFLVDPRPFVLVDSSGTLASVAKSTFQRRGKVAASPLIAEVIWVVTIFSFDMHLSRVQYGQQLSVDEPLRTRSS